MTLGIGASKRAYRPPYYVKRTSPRNATAHMTLRLHYCWRISLILSNWRDDMKSAQLAAWVRLLCYGIFDIRALSISSLRATRGNLSAAGRRHTLAFAFAARWPEVL